MGYGYQNNKENLGYNGCGCNNNDEINNFKRLVKAFLAAHKDFEDKLDESSKFANKALCLLKESATAYNCSLKYTEKISEWIEKYGCRYDYDFDGCEDIACDLEKLLCEINKEMKESLKTLYKAVEEINDVKELDNEFDKKFEKYGECIEDKNDDGCGCKGRR